MIATVKATGFTYNVTGFSDDGSIKLEDGNWYSMEELEIGEGYDWHQVRIQAAIAAMQGMMASEFYCSTKTRNDSAYTKYREKWDARTIAKEAVVYADLLIEELQKKGEQNG